MNYLHLTLPTPAENLAADEALLDLAENEGVETLRIWESAIPFVVLGLSNHVAHEVNVSTCVQRGIPILRRVSGGGTVLQGPGCLSYALTLRIPDTGPLTTITGTNQFIMEGNRSAIERAINQPVAVRGHTDLETGGRKFSGNAQRRGRRALLFHGTILYAADLALIDRVLLHPSREPAWREHRAHDQFMGNIAASRDQIIAALREAWSANETASFELAPHVLAPLAARHTDPAWINRLA